MIIYAHPHKRMLSCDVGMVTLFFSMDDFCVIDSKIVFNA